MENKKHIYFNLVQKRKTFNFPIGLSNYNLGEIDFNFVDAWEMWHSNLNAKIMLIGQDFADFKTFKNDNGKVEPNDSSYKYKTNENLELLFRKGLGIKIGHPSSPCLETKLFFTNAIIGLKEKGGMQGEIKKEWRYLCTKEFLKPLIVLVNPPIIIAMGQLSFKSVCEVFNGKISPNIKQSEPFKNSVGKVFISENNTHVYPVYHCGSRGVNLNRKLDDQINDWQKIGEALKF